MTFVILKSNIFQIKNIKKSAVLLVFGLKLISGLILSGLYSNFYSDGKLVGDTAHYFEEGKILQSVFEASPQDYFTLLISSGSVDLVENRLKETNHWTRDNLDQFNDNRFIIRINSLISFFSFGSYLTHVIVFSFLALIGLVLFYKSIASSVSKYHLPVFLIICLFPSILFWTSSILKESLLIFGFGLFLYGLLRIKFNFFKGTVLLTVGLFFLINTKVYFFICLVPCLLIYFILNQNWKRSSLILSTGGLITISLFFAFILNGNFKAFENLSEKQRDFNLVGKGGVYFMDEAHFYRVEYNEIAKLEIQGTKVGILEELNVEVKPFGAKEFVSDSVLVEDQMFDLYLIQVPPNSYVEIPLIQENGLRFLANIPYYISNVFLLPFPWSNGSSLKWLNFLENMFLLFLILFSFYFRKKVSQINQKLFFSSLLFIFVFYLIIGTTTPVIGAIVRYKTPAFLIWILFFLSIIDLERITLKRNK